MFLTLLFEICLNPRLCIVPKIYIVTNVTLKLKKKGKNYYKLSDVRDATNFIIKYVEIKM